MSSSSDSLSQLDCYRPSGAVPIFGAFMTLVAAAASGVVLGTVYAFVNHHDPLVYLNILLALGLGIALGLIVSRGVRLCRIRSRAAAAVIAFAAFAAAYAAHWPVYLATVFVDFSPDFSSYDMAAIAQISAELARDPEGMWEFIRDINESGVWSLSGSSSSNGIEVSGIFLTLIWAAEAIMICFQAVKRARDAAGKPYSERRDEWLEPRTLPGYIAFVENKEEFTGAVIRGDYSALTAPITADERKYAQVVLYNDAFEPCVSVTNVSQADGNKKSGESFGKKLFRWFIWDTGGDSADNVVQYLRIPPSAAQNILTTLGKADAPS